MGISLVANQELTPMLIGRELQHSHKNTLVWKRTIAYFFNFSMLVEQQQQPASAFHRIWVVSFTEKFSNQGN